jgi:magnesium transporter
MSSNAAQGDAGGQTSNNGQAKYFLVGEVVGAKVRSKDGTKLGKLKDLLLVDDPKYAEVTALVVGRPYGDRPLLVPWASVVDFGASDIVVETAPVGGYHEIGPEEDLLLLRDKILDKKILDTEGFAVEVVYDIQLMLADSKLFVVAADIGRRALVRRLGLGRIAGGGRETGLIPWKYVQPLGTDLTPTKGDLKLTVTKDRLGEIHPEDAADILEELGREERIHIFNALDSKTAAAALDAAEPRVQREILAGTSAARVAQIFTHLSAVEIAEIISILPREDAEEFQKILSGDRASRVKEMIDLHDVPASTMAVRRVLEFPEDITVEQAFTRFRQEAPTRLVTMYIYVVDDEKRLQGVVDINELLQASPDAKLKDIMTTDVIAVGAATNRGYAESLFRRYHFRAIPVVDESKKIIGVIREKDIFSRDDEIRLSR